MPDTALTATKSIGKGTDRVDGRLKVTGGARYSAEMPVSGVAYAVLIMSTIPAGTVRAMDTAAAERQPGVLAVWTPFNAPRLPQKPAGAKKSPQDRILSLLQDNNVYYNNQPIGLVLSETLEAAQYAASLVDVQYDRQKAALDIRAEENEKYAPAKANQEPTDSSRGDADSAYKAAPHQLRNLYTTPVENHNPMEPHATTAVWDKSSGHLTVYDATQGVSGVQGVLSRVFQIPQANVHVISYFIGGGFGCKGSTWSHVPLAAMAARALDRPVKLVLSRQQMFGMVGYRPITHQTVTLGADDSGALVATRHDVYTQTSTFDEFVEPCAAATRMLYSCPNVETTHRLTKLNYGTPTFMRAPGESSGTWALESAMDELAYDLKMDPVAFRLKNYAEKDEDQNKPFSSKSLRQCYQLGAERFDWDRRKQEPRSVRNSDGLLVGYGMATATYPTRRSPSSALARIMPDGSGYILAGTQDIGTGTYTILTQIAADGMGLPIDKVRVEIGDTDFPQTPVSGGSQTAASTGSAVLQASQAARQKLISLAIADTSSPLSGLSPDDVVADNGRLVSKADPSKGEEFSTLISRNKLPSVEAEIHSEAIPEAKNYSMHSFGAVFTEVTVDPDLGMIRLQHIQGVYAVGRLLNAKTGRSQLMGGIVFGIGMALLEETLVDRRSGRIVNADLAEYHVPVNRDVPRIDIASIEEDDRIVNPLGIKGIGEIGITGVTAAIGNAVFNATGVRVRDLPITLDKIIAT